MNDFAPEVTHGTWVASVATDDLVGSAIGDQWTLARSSRAILTDRTLLVAAIENSWDTRINVSQHTCEDRRSFHASATESTIMTDRDKAVAYFMQGYNCAQAVAAAFAASFGLEEAVALKLTAGFGAGMGGMRGTCGAVSALVFLAGLQAGAYPPEDRASKKALYDLTKKMVREFSFLHGTTCCAELLTKASCLPKPDPAERGAEYYAKRPCVRFVASAAEIISRTLRTG
jgi:C_GCAxxG_C_C family probable redox protein